MLRVRVDVYANSAKSRDGRSIFLPADLISPFGRWEPALLADGVFDVVELQAGLAVAAAPMFRIDAFANPAVEA